MPITYQALVNPSHVVYGAYTRDCGVEGYGGPQGPQKLLDNGDFGLATYLGAPKSKLITWSSLMRHCPSKINLLVATSLPATTRTHLSSPAASIPTAITVILEPSTSIL
ncbi:hypothetical protein Pyn_28697 [Prunus yedoensis var. nudiflora]|uniref:Uncharacterized protein n=1 Tax=Prunus yedoensis var. nudiflora TaxID=2094558 RepID=A0A314ZRD1_PRUYE|nr:hypothetical protein Pyn_28697 [Prunus yedoensis var. nudiflora]